MNAVGVDVGGTKIAAGVVTPEGKIRLLDIYEQATDSGRWIAEAAEQAMGG